MLSVLRDGKLITEKKKSSETLTERFRELAVICFNRICVCYGMYHNAEIVLCGTVNKYVNRLCPNGLELVVLNKICEVYDGTHQTPKYTDSGIKFVSVENISSPYDTQK